MLTLLEIWQAQLLDWAVEGSISKAARSALALEGEQPLLLDLESAWAAGNFSGLPPVELLPASSMPSAAGAYAASTGTIYLNQDWLNAASEEQVSAVLTEELGHHLDAQLNEIDAWGDEGQQFREFLLGKSNLLGNSTLSTNDQILLSVSGEYIEAEAAMIYPITELREVNDIAINESGALLIGTSNGVDVSSSQLQYLNSNGELVWSKALPVKLQPFGKSVSYLSMET